MAWWDAVGGAAGAVGTGLGVGADIYSFIRAEKERRDLQRLYDVLADPVKMQQKVAESFVPMSAAQNQAVLRDLGANWSVMTGGAPGGAMNQFVADALAKIESDRYNEHARNVLAAYSRAGGNIPQAPPGGNTGNILRNLMVLRELRRQPTGGTPVATAPGQTPGIVAEPASLSGLPPGEIPLGYPRSEEFYLPDYGQER